MGFRVSDFFRRKGFGFFSSVGSEFGVWSLGFAPECCTEQEAAAAAPHGMDTDVQPTGLDALRRNRENLWPSEYFGFRV